MNSQLLFTIIFSILSVVFIIVGIYLIFFLNGLRKMLKRVDKIFDDLHFITGTVSKPLSVLLGVFSSLVGGFKAANSIKTLRDDRKEDE